MSGLGPSFMKISTFGSSPRSGYRNARTRIKNVNGASRLSKFWTFFGATQMISCRDWWPWTKPDYITMTRKQSNSKWSNGIVAHSDPKKFRVQKSAGKVLVSIFWDQDSILPPHRLSFKGPNYQRAVFLISAGEIEGHFEGKTPREVQQSGLVLARQCPDSPGTCNPERNWSTWASNVLITHHILRIWPRRTTTCFLDWKTIERSPFFVQCGGHSCRGDLVGRTSFWFFLSGLQKLEQWAKKCIELRGLYVE